MPCFSSCSSPRLSGIELLTRDPSIRQRGPVSFADSRLDTRFNRLGKKVCWRPNTDNSQLKQPLTKMDDNRLHLSTIGVGTFMWAGPDLTQIMKSLWLPMWLPCHPKPRSTLQRKIRRHLLALTTLPEASPVILLSSWARTSRTRSWMLQASKIHPKSKHTRITFANSPLNHLPKL